MDGIFRVDVEMSGRDMMSSCIPKFYCTETASSICDDKYTYKCPHFEPQSDPKYDFSGYCVHDNDRCGVCTCQDAILGAIKTELQKSGRHIGRIVYKVPKPSDCGEDSFNNKG